MRRVFSFEALVVGLSLGSLACGSGIPRDPGNPDPDPAGVDARAQQTPPRANGGASGAGGAGGGGGSSMPAGGDASGSGGSKSDGPINGSADAAASGGDAADASAPLAPFVPPDPTATLPLFMIDVKGQTISPDTDVIGSLKIITVHEDTNANLDKAKVDLEVPISISVHGSSSAGWPQKSFGFEIQDAAKNAKSTAVLGFPADSDWVLLACWTDKTCMRNALVYAVAAGLTGSRWNPQGTWAEVYVDNKYNGLYFLSEAIRRGKKRVDIPKAAPDKATGDVTGGYIVSRELAGKNNPNPGKTNPPTDWISPVKGSDNFQMIYTYREPHAKSITTEQKAYLQDYFARFEKMMLSTDWNTAKGYPFWMDVKAAVDYALVHELTADVDSYWKSMYYTKDSDDNGGKLFMNPLWDFNLSFGGSQNRESWKTTGLVSDFNKRFGGECSDWVPNKPASCDCPTGLACPHNVPFVPFYWAKIWSDPAFKNALKCRWNQLRKGPIDSAFFDAKIKTWQPALVKFAMPRHFARWPDLKKTVDPNPCGKDTPDPCASPTLPVDQFVNSEITWMRNWIKKRIDWLDANLPGTCAP